jgi:hypothetical protein
VTETRRHDAIALAILSAIVTLLFADVLLGINALYVRDLVHYYYPAKHVLREIVLGGEFPYWNPWFGAGQPMAANPEHEVFYPLTWLILLPGFRAGFHLLTLIHLYIAGFTMYALLRSMRARAAAAFFGALSFAIGGIALSYLNLLPYLFTIAWLPLTCLYTRRFLLHRSWRDFALASFFFGVELWIGEPSTILQTGLLLGMYALHRDIRARSVRAVAMVGLISIAAFAVGAVQMIPTLDHAADSVRARGFAFSDVSDWSTPVARLAEFLYPNVLGHLDLGGRRLYWGASLYERGAPFLYSIYPGLLISVLALSGFFARVRGWTLALGIGIASTIFALGAHTPLWQWLYDAGVMRSLRYPEKFILLAVFATIVFGTRVLDELLDGNERVRKCALAIAIVVTSIAALAALFARMPHYAPLFTSLWSPRADRTAAMLAASATGWLAAAARAGAVLLLVRNASRRRMWLAVAATFVTLDLGMVLFEAVPRMPVRYYDDVPALAQRLPADRSSWRLFHHADWHKLKPEVVPYFAPHPDLYWVHRNAMFPMTPAQYGVRMALDTDYDLTALVPTTDFVQSVADLSGLRRDWVDVAASMSNVWYRAVFIAPQEAFATARGDRRVMQPVGLIALERYPRYYFADRVERIADREEFVRKVGSMRFSKRTAFVREGSFVPAPGRVTAATDTANTARIEVETAGRAFLIISVTPHKYWRITIDGIEAPAVVTNVGYQGVLIPAAGKHLVEMRYRNPLIVTSGAVSVAALLALALLASRATRTMHRE